MLRNRLSGRGRVSLTHSKQNTPAQARPACMQSSRLATLHGKMHTGGMCKLPGGSTNLGPAEQNATHLPVEHRAFGFASMLLSPTAPAATDIDSA
ncbi:hypothetical protein ACSS6W_009684 [Trichoderma asperelloides]